MAVDQSQWNETDVSRLSEAPCHVVHLVLQAVLLPAVLLDLEN